jgi:hypothetical protein
VLLSAPKSPINVGNIVQNTAFSIIPSIIEATLGELSGHGYLGEYELSDDFFSHVQELVVQAFDFDQFSDDLVAEFESKSSCDVSSQPFQPLSQNV